MFRSRQVTEGLFKGGSPFAHAQIGRVNYFDDSLTVGIGQIGGRHGDFVLGHNFYFKGGALHRPYNSSMIFSSGTSLFSFSLRGFNSTIPF